MKKLRLLYVVDDLSVANGPNWQLRQLTKLLSPSDFEIHVLSLGDCDDSEDLISSGIELHFINRHRSKLTKAIELRRLIEDLVPDVVHAWGYPTHLLVAFSQYRTNRPKLVYSYFCLPPRRLMLRRWLDEFVTREPATITVTHSALGESLATEGMDNPYQVVPNAMIECETNKEQARQKLLDLTNISNRNVFLVGTVCCMEPRFRLKDLIWATDMIFCVRDDVHLLIFGFGSGKRALEYFLHKTEATTHVHFIDSRSLDVEQLIGLDAYWNSQIVEPNSVPMMTAISGGVPTISVLDESTNEVILPMQTGLATNIGARDEFARWTKFLIEQQTRGKELAIQGREYVTKRFPVRQMVDGFAEIYSSTTA